MQKLVTATARWALKHPVYGIVILWLGICTNRPNVSNLRSFIGSMKPSILVSAIQENKLLASVPCFQKIRLLSTNDLFFLTITCWPSRSFFLFLFLFHFYVHKNYTSIAIYEKTFLCTLSFLYMTNFFCIRIRTLSLYVTRSIYKPYLRSTIFFFVFPNTHLWFIQKFLYIHLLLTHTRISFHTLFTHAKILLYTFSFHIHIWETFFFFFIYVDIYSQHFFLFIMIFGSFYFLGRRS